MENPSSLVTLCGKKDEDRQQTSNSSRQCASAFAFGEGVIPETKWDFQRKSM